MNLLDMLRAFHAELAAFRSACGVGAGSEVSAAALRERLGDILDSQRAAVWAMGGEAAQIRYRAAEYAMCALADEIALGANWPGRNEWLEHLLETERFGSQAAGERLFQLMDAMLDRQPVRDVDLAQTYLATLALGFRGRYRASADEAALQRYRERLATGIGRRQDPRLCPEAHARAVTSGAGVLLPDLRRWIYALAALFIIYGALSHIVWTQATAGLDRALRAVQTP